MKVERGITINRSREEVFSFLRDVRNLPRFMDHLERVEPIDHKRSHWVARGSGGRLLEWDAEIINEHPNAMIAWESLAGAQAPNAGSVRLEPAPGGRGTEVRISLEVVPPWRMFGSAGARIFGPTPDREVEEDLTHLKQVLEAGEMPTTAGQPSGRTE